VACPYEMADSTRADAHIIDRDILPVSRIGC
jgi:hypothetical protein